MFPQVDVFAPGMDIISTWTGTETAFETMPGTSMACAHVSSSLISLISSELGALTDRRCACVPSLYLSIYDFQPHLVIKELIGSTLTRQDLHADLDLSLIPACLFSFLFYFIILFPIYCLLGPRPM